MSDWCILQMHPARTMPAFRALGGDGFDVWTPAAMRRRKVPRSRKYCDEVVAVLPGFVFARYDNLSRLCIRIRYQHDIWLLSHRGQFPSLPDGELRPLREHEARLAENWEQFAAAERLARKRKARWTREQRNARSVGERVHIPDTAFQGLSGRITEVRRNGSLRIVFESGGEVIAAPYLVAPAPREAA